MREGVRCSLEGSLDPNLQGFSRLKNSAVQQDLERAQPPLRKAVVRGVEKLRGKSVVSSSSLDRKHATLSLSSTSQTTHRLRSSSFLWFLFRILNGNPKKELLWSLWVNPSTPTVPAGWLPVLRPANANPVSSDAASALFQTNHQLPYIRVMRKSNAYFISWAPQKKDGS